MDRLIPTLFAVALVLVLFLLMWLGWRGRLKRQSGLEEPRPIPADLGAPLFSSEGSYVSTTSEGDWLDRVAVHSLGIRTDAVLEVHAQGLAYRRKGVPDFFVPVAELLGIRTASGMAGKFVERDGLVVATWKLGTERVDTGFRTRAAEDRPALIHAITALLPETTP